MAVPVEALEGGRLSRPVRGRALRQRPAGRALTHLPLAPGCPYGAVHLYGYLHARGDPAPRRRDVGVDAIGFAPRRLDWLLEDLAADSSD